MPDLDTLHQHVRDKSKGKSKLFWVVFFSCVFFIVCGSMLIYESQSTTDTDMNVGLIVVGGIALGFTAVLLIALVMACRNEGKDFSLWYIILALMIGLLSCALGTMSIINGVDVPNNPSRATLGQVFGGITVGFAILGVLVSMYALWVHYYYHEDAGYLKQ